MAKKFSSSTISLTYTPSCRNVIRAKRTSKLLSLVGLKKPVLMLNWLLPWRYYLMKQFSSYMFRRSAGRGKNVQSVCSTCSQVPPHYPHTWIHLRALLLPESLFLVLWFDQYKLHLSHCGVHAAFFCKDGGTLHVESDFLDCPETICVIMKQSTQFWI